MHERGFRETRHHERMAGRRTGGGGHGVLVDAVHRGLDFLGHRIGSLAVCFLRLLITCVFLSVYGGVVRNSWLPTDADRQTWWLLGLSGMFGFFVADVCSFRALLLIGPRLTLLILSLIPPTAAVLSWIFLEEQLTLRHWLAMAITLAGITWVVLERSGAAGPSATGAAPRLGPGAGHRRGRVGSDRHGPGPPRDRPIRRGGGHVTSASWDRCLGTSCC